ncbi:hypothetical protein [Williamsia sp. DF01-3]|uniref:hypothetical protein n=1 Tax=Williamsia sp. DF01-3 TaxID=2934157 RepID=UPI001FF507EB|nr:hypothetical protein [Williamsia sp. DF01-3]MCK0518871.1 hypothetical protein [Williamsia sp. DF01-3]
MDIDEVADELYGLDPAEFVEARKARVTQARKEGDRELATAIGKMRKPTLVAWVVNNFAREEPEQVEELLELGEALRDAQRHLSGDDLRALTTQRQRVIRAMARRAGELAATRGQQVSETAAREVGQSLHAALADPEIADLVRAGRLVTAASYSGMGPAGMTVVGGRSKPPTSGRKPDTTKLKADAQTEVDAAERAELEAREAVGTAQADAQEAADRVAELDSRIEDLRSQLAQAEQERQFAHKSERTAASNVTAAEHKAEQAQARLETARKKLADI